MTNSKEQNFSSIFYIIRGFAIISVAFAHCCSLPDNSIQRIGEAIGVLGVPLFLFCSGFYFKQTDWRTLVRKLSIAIISPWLIWGTFCFLLSYVLGGVSLQLGAYFSYILGHGTWLYYLPVYLVVRILFNAFHSNKFAIGAIVATILYSAVTTPPHSDLRLFIDWLTPYQNPLSWIGYYGLGIIFMRYNTLEWIFNLSITIKTSISIIFFALFFILVSSHTPINYWNLLAISMSITSLAVAPLVASFIKQNIILELLGKNSLLLYILHMQLGIGISNIFFRLIRVPNIIILFVKPLIVLAITLLLIYLMKYALRLTHLNRLNRFLGIA